MKSKCKKLLVWMLTVVLLVSVIPIGTMTANAATLTLSQLKAKYPQGKYWNHVGSSSNNADGYTSSPCPSHSSTSTCNAFISGGTKIGWQCFGFSLKLGYDAYGSNPKNWARAYNLNNIKPGDIINYDGSNPGHTVFVTGVSGDTVSFAECNYGGRCLIRWDRSLKKTQFNNLYNVYVAPSALPTGTHSHSYSRGTEAAHPHKVYMKCSCGDYYYIEDSSFNVNCSTCNDTSAVSKYPIPFKAKTLGTGKTLVSNTNGTMDAKSNKIYDTDLCVIDKVYANGWCHVSFPLTSGGSDSGYVPLSTFLNTNASLSTQKVTAQTNTYYRSGGSEYAGYIGVNDTVHIVTTSGSYTQVFYPLNEGGYKLAWAILPSPPSNPVGSAVGCAERWIADADSGLKCRTSAGTSASEVVPGYGMGKGKEIIIAKKQSDSSGNLWGWGHGYNDSLQQYLEGWYCLNYAVYDSSYIPGVPSVSVTPAAYPDKTTISWTAASKATQYDVYIDGTKVASGLTSRTYNIALPGGSHNVKIASINTDFYYYGTSDCYSITNEVSFNTTTKQYSVTYNANGGANAPSVQYKLYNRDLTLSSSKPAKEGYTFKGWALDDKTDEVAYTPGSVYRNNSSTTLYAVWEANTYTISYNANGGSNAPASQTKTHDVPLTLTSEIPVYEGRSFIGWSTQSNSNGIEYVPGDKLYLNSDATLFAQWEASSVSSISIETLPAKTTYKIGDTLDTSGLKIKLTYSDGTTESITNGFTTSGFSSVDAGTKTVTVAYGGKTTSFTVVVESDTIDENAPQVIIEKKTAKAGESVDVQFKIQNAPKLKSFSITGLTYDTGKLSFEKAVCNIDGVAISQVQPNGNAIVALNNNTDINGLIFTYTFTVKESVEDCSIPINCTFSAKEKPEGGVEQAVAFATVAGEITVKNYITGDLNGDNVVDSDDSIYLLWYTYLPEDYPINQNADFNGDGTVDSDDSIYLLWHTYLPEDYPLN